MLFTGPFKTNLGADITRAFKNVLKSSKTKPKLKSVFAERVISTLRTRLERLVTHRGNFKYIDALPQITASYNSSYHPSIKMAPRDVVGAERE
jgi:hypothetical protein